MSKSTFALIAALGAGGGAALTASIFSRKDGSGGANAANPPSTLNAMHMANLQAVQKKNHVETVASGTATDSPVDPAGVFAYGFPGPVADLGQRAAHVSSFDRRLRNPHWVAEHITPASLAAREGDRKNSGFAEDESVPAKFRALLRDYARSGYDRGHQVPAADARWSQRAVDDTFLLTNMCPQVGEGFNRDYWAHLEDFCRRLTGRYPSVRVVTGPLYLPARDPADGKNYVRYEVIGNPPSVAVPTHFFKVIFAEDGRAGGKVAVGAFVLPNRPIPNDKPLADWEVPVEAVERASGLEFVAKLEPARRLRLCADTTCSLLVKNFAQTQRSMTES